MVERALSFGPVAAAYERFRLGYPDELADAVLAYAGRPVRTALEIGAGTGKATRLFAARGIAVTAVEPDAAMLAELHRRVPATVVVACASFEELPLTTAHDLVFAAAALHWTAPQRRWARIAALLNAGGTFASFGGPIELADPALADAVRAARSPHLLDDGVPSPDGTPAADSMQWPGTELERSEHFVDIRQLSVGRSTTWSTEEYLGHLSTISAYLQLPTTTRVEVFDRIAGVLPERVDVNADLTLHLARKA